ncbi:MAG: hypothetical protein H0T69_17365 [Thermoleophilaceae bacterium]|nr:hypothetical protein [Thermoleophilaceae bacterium]
MPLPPAFEDRKPAEQIIGAVVVTMVFGLLTGFALGWNEIVYYILAGPIAIAGGFVGGMEHRAVDEGFVRGAMGGLVFGSFILLGLEILNDEPAAYLGKPHVGLVFVTTIGGSILGAVGAAYRARRERELGAASS